MTSPRPACDGCVHMRYMEAPGDTVMVCDAYPLRIPARFWEELHDRVQPDQVGALTFLASPADLGDDERGEPIPGMGEPSAPVLPGEEV